MSKSAKTKPAADAPEEIEECPRCGKPLPLCICDSVTPIKSKVSLLILQHPAEAGHAKNTAALLTLGLQSARVLRGEVFAASLAPAGTAA